MGEKGNVPAAEGAASLAERAAATAGGLAGIAAGKATELSVEAGVKRMGGGEEEAEDADASDEG